MPTAWDALAVAWDDPDYSWLGASTDYPPLPPGIELARDGTLGRTCVYQVFTATRSGNDVISELPFTAVEWERVASGVSTASIELKGIGGELNSTCCALLEDIDPWANELHVYRNAKRVWAGPIVGMELSEEEVSIRAEDPATWLGERRLHQNHRHIDVDLSEVFASFVEDAMSVDNVPGLVVASGTSGIKGTRRVRKAQRKNALAELGELARTGVTWTVVDRELRVYGTRNLDPPIALRDAHFTGSPSVTVGDAMATEFSLFGEGRTAKGPLILGVSRTHDSDIIDRYGVHEVVESEDRIKDTASARRGAARRRRKRERPPTLFTGGDLDPMFPLEVNDLVPGLRVDADLRNSCRKVRGRYRVTKVTGRFGVESDSIGIDVQPPGDTNA